MAFNGSIAAQSTAGSDVAVALLKPIFDTGIQEVIPAEFKFWKYATKNGEDLKLAGDHYEFQVHLSRNARAESFNPSDVMPASGVAKFAPSKIYVKRVAQPLALDHEFIMLADSDAAAFSVRAEALYEDAKDAMLRDLNRQAVGDGTGVLAAVVVPGTLAAAISPTMASSKFFEEDMHVEIWNAARTTQRVCADASKYGAVTSINSATAITITSITGSAWVGVVATDVICKKNSQAGSGVSKDIEGLQKIVGATAPADYQALSGSTYRRWNATRYNVNGVISPKAWGLAQIAARAASASSGKWDTIFTSPVQALQLVYGTTGGMYEKAGANAYSKGDLTTQGLDGQDAPKVNLGSGPVTVESDLDLPDTSLFCFPKSELVAGELHPVKLEKWGNSTSLPAYDPTANGILAADQMWFTFRGNFGCRKRNEFVELYGCTTA